MKAEHSRLRKFWMLIKNISIAIVSGIPRGKVLVTPENPTHVYAKNEMYKDNNEKHYHRPIAKPTVEKQTLLKENKKSKAAH